MSTPIQDLPAGSLQNVAVRCKRRTGSKSQERHSYAVEFEGIMNFLRKQMESDSETIRELDKRIYPQPVTCPECNGLRLKKESLHIKIDQKNIGELSQL